MRRPRASALLLTIAALVVAAPAVAADPPLTIENVRVGFGRDQAEQTYKIGRWTAVRVDLKAGPQPFEGTLEVIAPDDTGTPAVFRRPVTLAAGQFATFVGYARPGEGSTGSDPITVTVRNARGRVVDRMDSQSTTGVEAGRVVLATIGPPGGVELLPARVEFKTENNANDSGLILAPLAVPEGVPSSWLGYDAADVVVLNTNDPAALDVLQFGRDEALRDWLLRGGHLVVVVGDRWQAVRESFLAGLLPALPTGQSPLADPSVVESFANSDRPITKDGGPTMQATALELVPARGGRALDLSSGSPLVARGHYGFGRVTVVGLNVDQKPFADWADRDDFWLRAIDLARTSATTGAAAGAIAPAPVPGAFYGNAEAADLGTYLAKSLEQFPGVTPVPFGWVAFFVFLYILLIGPGDYLFLKKVVKRMELTWITFPAIVLAVSLLAYAAAYAVKGTDLRINRAEVVDVDQQFPLGGGVLSRGASFTTLFSPQNRDYDVALAPLPLDQPPPAAAVVAQAAPPAAVPPGAEVVQSWYGMVDNRFGGNRRFGLGGDGYTYRPDDRVATLQGVRVPIWTTKGLLGNWVTPIAPPIEADLRRAGTDRLEGTITNRTARPLLDAAIVFAGQAFVFKAPIAPGETVAVETLTDQNLTSYLGAIHRAIPRLNGWQMESAQLNASRADLLRAALFAGVLEGKPDALPSRALRALDLTPQAALDRPILVARLEGPASAIGLGGAPSAPKVDQTTLLRVILTAAGEADAPPAPVVAPIPGGGR